MDHLRSNEDIGKMKGTRSTTHGGDRKTRPITNHDCRRIRGMWRSDRRKKSNIRGGVVRGTRASDPLGADSRCHPHGVECMRWVGVIPPPPPQARSEVGEAHHVETRMARVLR
jgi:hypothetical protein